MSLKIHQDCGIGFSRKIGEELSKKGGFSKSGGDVWFFTVLCRRLMLPGTILEEHGHRFIEFGQPE